MENSSVVLTCIGCPLGCGINVELKEGEIESISGYTCKRGLEYARAEVTSPTRTITSSVRVLNGERPVVAVKTSEPIPKERIFEVMKSLYGIQINAPVEIGQVICENVAGTGVAVRASAVCRGA